MVRAAVRAQTPGEYEIMPNDKCIHILNRPAVLLATVLLLSGALLHGATPISYEAVFADGTRLVGEKITGWGLPSETPKLDGASLQDPKRPLRWLRNRTLKPWRKGSGLAGHIEFVGGDRIVGRIVGARPSRNFGGVHVPAHLLVMPAKTLRSLPYGKKTQPVRVLIEGVRRIVMTENPRITVQPGTLIDRDGRRVRFVSIRPGENSLRLLMSDGSREMKLDNVAEINFPRIDPWEEYFRTLGIIRPDCESRIVRIETTGGLIATASDLRFRPMAYSSPEYRTRMLEHRKRLGLGVKQMAESLPKIKAALEKTRADYAKKWNELDKPVKAARQAYEKAKSDLQRRIDQDKKRDASRPDKERGKLEAKRRKELADFETSWINKIKRLEAARSSRSRGLKQQMDRAVSKLERYPSDLARAKERLAVALGENGAATSWHHMIQPAWSLDALPVPFIRFHMRWSFSPGRVPLSMIDPTRSVTPPLQPARAGRNAAGELFCSGKNLYAWGFGVHAYSELIFELPRCANSFQARLGLDNSVAGGGCVRARVLVGSTEGRPLYESPMLIGSDKVVDTGPVAIPAAGDGKKRLILQADIAHKNRPPLTDPLNIRDKLNWLDPIVGFDRSALQTAVLRRAVRRLHPWKGWDAKFDKKGKYVWSSRYKNAVWPVRGRFLTSIRAEKAPLVLSREITVGPFDNWVTVDAGDSSSALFKRETLSIRIAGKEASPEPTPVRQEWQEQGASPTFGIAEHRGRKITIEIVQSPQAGSLNWRSMRISEDVPGEYRLARLLKKIGKPDMKVVKGLGWGLQSDGLDDAGRLAMLDIHNSGGRVNFWNPTVKPMGPGELGNILIGAGWTGGDKGFAALEKVGGLKSLLLIAGDAKVSDAAVEKLRARRPDIVVRMFDHTPSYFTARSHMVMKNLTGSDVMVYWVNFNGKHQYPRKMKPNANVHQPSVLGCRYEAYFDDMLIGTFTTLPGKDAKAYAVWEIKRQ